MNARHELEKRLFSMVSGDNPITEEEIKGILKDYIILRENEEEKSEFLTTWERKGSTGYPLGPSQTTSTPSSYSPSG